MNSSSKIIFIILHGFHAHIRLVALALVLMPGCEKSKEEDLKSKARSGDVRAMYELGMANTAISGDGIVSNPNYRDAVYWFEEAAKRGHTTSMYFLSQVGGQPKGRQAMWLKKGAELGNEACVIALMNGYRFGNHGLPKDTGAAIFWELKRGELYLKRDKKSPEETRDSLTQWEQRYRRENHYDGPIRPLP